MPKRKHVLVRERARRTRALLVTAAREEFGRRGLSAPVDEIVRRARRTAKISKGAVYYHFRSKEELIKAVEAEIKEERGHMSLSSLLERMIDDPDARILIESALRSRNSRPKRMRRG